jgi:toxin ParE1/3/4
MPTESSRRHEFHPAARQEFLDALSYYQETGQVGTALQEEVSRALEMLLAYPESSPIVTVEGARRRPLRRFPYSLYYFVRPDVIYIVAVAHQSRRPDYWADRME